MPQIRDAGDGSRSTGARDSKIGNTKDTIFIAAGNADCGVVLANVASKASSGAFFPDRSVNGMQPKLRSVSGSALMGVGKCGGETKTFRHPIVDKAPKTTTSGVGMIPKSGGYVFGSPDPFKVVNGGWYKASHVNRNTSATATMSDGVQMTQMSWISGMFTDFGYIPLIHSVQPGDQGVVSKSGGVVMKIKAQKIRDARAFTTYIGNSILIMENSDLGGCETLETPNIFLFPSVLSFITILIWSWFILERFVLQVKVEVALFNLESLFFF